MLLLKKNFHFSLYKKKVVSSLAFARATSDNNFLFINIEFAPGRNARELATCFMKGKDTRLRVINFIF